MSLVPPRNKPRPASPFPVVDGRYEIHAELGRGALGIVYLARDVGLARDVAVKMLAEERTHDPVVVARLRTEAQALATVRSPYVVQVYAFGRHRNAFYFAMEHVRGRSLASVVDEHSARGASLPFARAAQILTHLAEGLRAVHAVGLVHGDVKPENVVIEDESGRPVLVDFGLARGETAQGGFVGGTPGYMAPEQAGLLPHGVTARSDVYALGCTAYEMLMGEPPFRGGSATEILRAQMQERPHPVGATRQELSGVDAILGRAMALDPAERFASCDEMASAFAATAPPPNLPRPPATRASIATLEKLPEPGRLTVLAADPDPAAVKVLTTAARITFFGRRVHIVTAGSAAEVVARAALEPPSLLLLGYEMNDADGLTVLTAVRAMPRGESVRVVVMATPIGLRATRFRFSLLGVKHFVVKPLSLQAVVDEVGAIARAAGWLESASVEQHEDD